VAHQTLRFLGTPAGVGPWISALWILSGSFFNLEELIVLLQALSFLKDPKN
jgi:hypothetical protein